MRLAHHPQVPKQEFLLSFEKDRQRWRHWFFEAKKRYCLCVLNYIVTSNHIHLLVVDTKKEGIALKEVLAPYNTLFEGEKCTLRPDNSYFIDLNASNSN